jgi:hypothetical protein
MDILLWRSLFVVALLAPIFAGAAVARVLRWLRKQRAARRVPPDQSKASTARLDGGPAGYRTTA